MITSTSGLLLELLLGAAGGFIIITVAALGGIKHWEHTWGCRSQRRNPHRLRGVREPPAVHLPFTFNFLI